MVLIIFWGVSVGSFLNVCIFRLPLGRSIAWPPSSCLRCGKQLRAWDLVPVLSWLWLRGRCRYCGVKISFRYAAVELLTGLVFLGLWWLIGPTWQFVQAAVMASVLIVITFTDLDHRIIPNKVVLFGLVVGLPLVWLSGSPGLADALAGVLVGALPLFLLAVLTNGMGGGDVKLVGMLGLYLGWSKVLMMIFLASGMAAIIGIVLMLLGKVKRRQPIPFGPFIAVATMLVYLWGDLLLFWYNLFFARL